MGRKVVLALRMAVVAPLFMVFTILLATVIVAIALVRQDAPLIQKLIELWSRLFLRGLGSKLTIEGGEDLDPSGQYVFVANHLSNADIPVMFLTAPVPIRYLAKKEVYKIPMVGPAMRRIGMVRVDREAGSSIHAEVNTGVAAAKSRGHSIIIFPEGTRSVSGEPAQFKKGAFRIAIASRLPVVPVSIHGTWEVWPPGARVVTPGAITAIVHPVIPTAGMTLADIDGLRNQTETAIVAGWERLRSAPVR